MVTMLVAEPLLVKWLGLEGAVLALVGSNAVGMLWGLGVLLVGLYTGGIGKVLGPVQDAMLQMLPEYLSISWLHCLENCQIRELMLHSLRRHFEISSLNQRRKD